MQHDLNKTTFLLVCFDFHPENGGNVPIWFAHIFRWGESHPPPWVNYFNSLRHWALITAAILCRPSHLPIASWLVPRKGWGLFRTGFFFRSLSEQLFPQKRWRDFVTPPWIRFLVGVARACGASKFGGKNTHKKTTASEGCKRCCWRWWSLSFFWVFVLE